MINGSVNLQRGDLALQKVLNLTQSQIYQSSAEPKADFHFVNVKMMQELLNNMKNGIIDIDNVKMFTMRNNVRVLHIEIKGAS